MVDVGEKGSKKEVFDVMKDIYHGPATTSTSNGTKTSEFPPTVGLHQGLTFKKSFEAPNKDQNFPKCSLYSRDPQPVPEGLLPLLMT